MATSILVFRNLQSYITFWDKKVQEAKAAGGNYGRYLDDAEDKFNQRRSIFPETLGEPLPNSYTEALERRVFLNNTIYEDAFREIQPFLQQLEKLSEAILPKPVIMTTDREVGIFSFDRAMMGIDATPALYSITKKKYFRLYEGIAVLDKNGLHLTKMFNGQEYPLYKDVRDGSELILKQLEVDGTKDWGTTNKSSFLMKKNVEKPNRAIRIFILVGNNDGLPTFWAGLAGVIVAVFLESIGYSVRITAATGVRTNNNGYNDEGTFTTGVRFNTIDLKRYQDTMDSQTLLYVTADSSFFRVRCFDYFMAEQYYRRDVYNSGLGSMASERDLKEAVLTTAKAREGDEKNTLYYYFGGREIDSLSSARDAIERLVTEVETTNKDLLTAAGLI
jgi:hypothetical protein